MTNSRSKNPLLKCFRQAFSCFRSKLSVILSVTVYCILDVVTDSRIYIAMSMQGPANYTTQTLASKLWVNFYITCKYHNFLVLL